MADHYRYGIDLGTTNSVIARFDEGAIHLFTNPGDLGRRTLPSVVGWQKDRVFVGEKARERASKPLGHGNTVAGFKRRMGTSEAYRIEATGATVTPVDLSAEVLKELRRFVSDDPAFSSAVVTVPASFNTQQANATSEAARLAGIKHVALLQEPIAASLAFANDAGGQTAGGKWLVYDLGGGTFDVALIEIIEDQLRVIDHEGDNFLGGRDFDAMMVDSLIVPRLDESFSFADLSSELRNASGKYNHIYEGLLVKAEKAKIELSTRESSEIDVDLDFEDDDGESVSATVTITRSDFERLVRPSVDRTITMIKTLLTRNKLRGSDLSFVLLVGGSTYIPCVRELVGQTLETTVRSDIDPATAVAIGAAYYASSKTLPSVQEEANAEAPRTGIRLKAAYQRSSRDSEEYYAARVEGWRQGLRYRIVRRDGGFDSNWKPLQEKIAEDLPLREAEFNYFTVEVTDEQGVQVQVVGHEIAIAHGKVTSGGQPLPEDISIERDSDAGRTILHPLFKRNAVLPAEAQPVYTINRAVVKGSSDVIRIRVMEGPNECGPAACLCIGELIIRGSELRESLYKGDDIEVAIRMDEDRSLSVTAHLQRIDQDFAQVYEGGKRIVNLGSLREEVDELQEEIRQEIAESEETEDFERARRLKELHRRADSMTEQLLCMGPDDGTDARYQCDNEKQRLAAEVSRVTADRHLRKAREEYAQAIELATATVEGHGSDEDKQLLKGLLEHESVMLASTNLKRIESETSRLNSLHWTVQMRRPGVLKGWFLQLCERLSSMNQGTQAQDLIKRGQTALDAADWAGLREVNQGLFMLLPNGEQGELTTKVGFY